MEPEIGRVVNEESLRMVKARQVTPQSDYVRSALRKAQEDIEADLNRQRESRLRERRPLLWASAIIVLAGAAATVATYQSSSAVLVLITVGTVILASMGLAFFAFPDISRQRHHSIRNPRNHP